ncbi:MAG TPA: DNA-formamidopyrimidine glycosylase family protein, partial [Solirubrobacterales bacterium]
EVEIAARRLDAALAGAEVESALAPGMNVMKTFDPPLDTLAGRELTAVRRVGKMPVVEFGDLALLIHLMSAGRLRVHDKRASLKDRASRVLIRLGDGRELRLREVGTKQRAWAKLLPTDAVAEDETVAGLGPEAWPPPPLEELAAAIDKPRHLHPLLRHQKDIAGIGRSWVDEILWEARLSPFRKGSELEPEEVERLHEALHVLGDAIDHYEATIGPEVPEKVPKPLKIHKHEGEPCPRCGATIEAVYFSEHQTNYCPQEQTGGRILKDRRLSKLLK